MGYVDHTPLRQAEVQTTPHNSVSNNTYQPVVSVLDVPSISNTKKAGGLLPTRGLTREKVRTIFMDIGKALLRDNN
jgi:hypothetical protein